MAFKDRISGMFRFGAKAKGERGDESGAGISGEERERTRHPEPEGGELTEALPATREEREAFLQEIGRGFINLGETVERLDRNLEAATEVQRRVPELIEEQQQLIRSAVDQGTAAREALQQLAKHLAERDQAQHAIVDRLEQINDAMRSQRDQHHRDVDLLMQAQRSGRTLTILFFLGGFVLVLVLLAALMLVALRSDLLGGQARAQAPASPGEAEATSVAPATTEPASRPDHRQAARQSYLRDAATSDDPLIADLAERILSARE